MLLTASLDRIGAQLARIDTLARSWEARVPRVSAWSVGEQLDHLLRVTRSVMRRIASPPEGNAAPAHGSATILGRLALLTGYFPRGMGRAPERVRPGPHTGDSLREAAATAVALVADLRGRQQEILRSRDRFPHPVFGTLTAAQWVRFVEVHQHHHLKIVEDILKRAGSPSAE